MEKETDIQIHEVQKLPNKTNPKRSKPKHTAIKTAKIKIKVVVVVV